MMLNGQSGCTSTGAGVAPAGSSQASKARPGAMPSSETQREGSARSPSAASAAASTNSSLACASPSIDAKLSGVTDGASGATTTPARRAPRNTAAWRGELCAQIAIASPGFRPARCSEAATRSISASSSA